MPHSLRSAICHPPLRQQFSNDKARVWWCSFFSLGFEPGTQHTMQETWSYASKVQIIGYFQTYTVQEWMLYLLFQIPDEKSILKAFTLSHRNIIEMYPTLLFWCSWVAWHVPHHPQYFSNMYCEFGAKNRVILSDFHGKIGCGYSL